MKKFTALFFAILLAITQSAQALTIDGAPRRRIMCVGDSITWTTGSTDGFSYRKNLQVSLGLNNWQFVGSKTDPTSDVTYYVNHEGIGGDNVEDVNGRIDAALDTYMPTTNNKQSMVLLYIGINDMNAAEAVATNVDVIADSTLTTSSIIGKIHAHDPNIIVIVGLIQPSTNATLNTANDNFNTALLARITALQATKTNLYTVDMNAAMENTANCATVSACMSDSLHPNDAGYVVMANTWYEGIKAVV